MKRIRAATSTTPEAAQEAISMLETTMDIVAGGMEVLRDEGRYEEAVAACKEVEAYLDTIIKRYDFGPWGGSLFN